MTSMHPQDVLRWGQVYAQSGVRSMLYTSVTHDLLEPAVCSLQLSFGGEHSFQTSSDHAGARDAHVLRERVRSREEIPFHRH